MKKIFITIFIIIPFISISQSTRQKLSRDSIIYYNNQLRELKKATYDSMVNSEKYLELTNKINSNEKITNKKRGMEFSFFGGYQIDNYYKLNARLASLNVKEQNGLFYPIGFGLAFRVNKIILGFDESIANGDNSTGGYSHIYLSTNIIKVEEWIFSPEVGYGLQGVKIRIPTQSSSTSFNSYFTTSSNQVEIIHNNSVLDFAIALKRLTPKNRHRYLKMLRFGYRYGLSENAWQMSNGTSTNAPTDRDNNFYFQIECGIGD